MDLIIFLVALSILVLVHEIGHFVMAIKNGIKVEEFGLGLPPKIFSKKIGETVFSLNLLPIGGFCRMYGEEASFAEGDKKRILRQAQDRAFCDKKPWQKMLVVVGGVLMNLVFAVVVFAGVYTVLGLPEETEKVKIIDVVSGSPADKANLKEDFWIYKVAGKAISKPAEPIEEVEKYKGGSVILIIMDEGKERLYNVEVRKDPPEGEGSMGVAISNTEMKKFPWWQFYKGIGVGFKEAYFWGEIIVGGVYKMISGLFMGQIPKDVSGPVGMYQATSAIKKEQGFLALIHFFGVVSVNLAIVNLLPFPALDGGRMIFVAYEMITKKRVNEKFEVVVNNVGMVILLGLLLLVTVGDIVRIVR